MMVDEYTADDLADGSENEKKIEKAERAAERNLGKRLKKRTAEAAVGKLRIIPARFTTVTVPPAAGPSLAQPPHSGLQAPSSSTRGQASGAMSLLWRNGPLAPVLPYEGICRREEVVSFSLREL